MTDLTNPTRQSFVIPALGGLYASTADLAEAGLRVATALFLVPHGVQKLFGWMGGYGLEATGQFFQAQLGFANGYLAALSAGVVEVFVALALAPGSFFMGMPFPTAIRVLERGGPDLIPWAWAINSFISVLASVVTVIVAMQRGFTDVMWIGGVFYVLAMIVFLARKVLVPGGFAGESAS